jgi:hypothetical protein
MENLLIKLMIYAALFITGGALLKIGNFYLLHKLAKEKAYANYKKKDLEELKHKKIKQQLELEDILLRKDVELYYKQAKDLFNEAIKSSNLTREQILYLKKVINDSLGDFINDYKYTHYKNDAHEIYSKLKCSHIKIPDFKKIIQLIKNFEAQTDNTYVTIVSTKWEKKC